MAWNILVLYEQFLDRFIWFIDGTLTDTTTPNQNETESNGNEGVLHTHKSSRNAAFPSIL